MAKGIVRYLPPYIIQSTKSTAQTVKKEKGTRTKDADAAPVPGHDLLERLRLPLRRRLLRRGGG
jgi:hypothetical protein